MIIIGLKTRAITERINAFVIIELKEESWMLSPSIIKNMIKKKSLNGRTFELISML